MAARSRRTAAQRSSMRSPVRVDKRPHSGAACLILPPMVRPALGNRRAGLGAGRRCIIDPRPVRQGMGNEPKEGSRPWAVSQDAVGEGCLWGYLVGGARGLGHPGLHLGRSVSCDSRGPARRGMVGRSEHPGSPGVRGAGAGGCGWPAMPLARTPKVAQSSGVFAGPGVRGIASSGVVSRPQGHTDGDPRTRPGLLGQRPLLVQCHADHFSSLDGSVCFWRMAYLRPDSPYTKSKRNPLKGGHSVRSVRVSHADGLGGYNESGLMCVLERNV